MTAHEEHTAGLDIVADQLSVVAAQLPDALGDRPLGEFAQFVVAGLRSAMGEAAAALAHAVSTSDELGAALRRGPAGLGWPAPFVSFLREPLDQLTGNPAPVTCGAQEYEHAGEDVLSAVATYRRTAGAAGYADAAAVLGESCATVASAPAGARAVVERAARVVAGAVADAIAEIVPVMAAAVARSHATCGTSVAEAVPRCVAIAVAAGERVARTLAALLASGQDLLELVAGAVVRAVGQELSIHTTPEENA